MLKKNLFTLGKKALNQNLAIPIGTKLATPYSTLFMAEMEKNIIKDELIYGII